MALSYHKERVNAMESEKKTTNQPEQQPETTEFAKEFMRQDDAQKAVPGMERKALGALNGASEGVMWYDTDKRMINYPLLVTYIIDGEKIRRTSSGIVDGQGRTLTDSDLLKLIRDELGKISPENVTIPARNALPVMLDKIPAEKVDTTSDGIGNYINSQMHADIASFTKASGITTGFKVFDEMTGGLYPGLYVLGAISSLGKTTYIHQMADQIAEHGKHVLFFSLEMSRLEMATKSISRMAAKLDKSNALPSLDIRKGTTSQSTKRAELQYVLNVGNNLNVIEGSFETTVSFISEYVRMYKQNTDETPVVIVDYLQVIQSTEKNTIRENVDFNVVELKRMSRELETPVILVSSINRANYLQPIDFEAFKESGCIEYTADVVLGLQLACLDEELFEKEHKIKQKRERIKEAKAENPRQVKLVCLKTRYGAPDWAIRYNYYPRYDLFEEVIATTTTNKPIEPQKPAFRI